MNHANGHIPIDENSIFFMRFQWVCCVTVEILKRVNVSCSKKFGLFFLCKGCF